MFSFPQAAHLQRNNRFFGTVYDEEANREAVPRARWVVGPDRSTPTVMSTQQRRLEPGRPTHNKVGDLLMPPRDTESRRLLQELEARMLERDRKRQEQGFLASPSRPKKRKGRSSQRPKNGPDVVEARRVARETSREVIRRAVEEQTALAKRERLGL